MFGLITACGGGDGSGGDDESSPPANIGGGNGAVAVATVTPGLPATATPTLEEVLRGFIYPIENGCLPEGQQLMPNAPREYRQGTHEGVDFYGVDNCTPIDVGTPVKAAKQGIVIRVDHQYSEPAPDRMNTLLADPLSEESLDAFRGRQVWIDHGGGVVSRYCHLASVANGLRVGDEIAAGTVVGAVGESGTPESLTNPGTQYHLHWEVRVGDSYLGAGEAPERVRELYLALFEP